MFATLAQAQTAQGAAEPSLWFNMLIIGGFVALFYFIAIRPQRKRQMEHQALVQALKKGDEVVLSGGLLGSITAIDDSYICLRCGDGERAAELRFQRHAVQAVLPRGTLKQVL